MSAWPGARQLGLFNHTSYVDAVVMMWLLTPSGVSKASNADIPLLGARPLSLLASGVADLPSANSCRAAECGRKARMSLGCGRCGLTFLCCVLSAQPLSQVVHLFAHAKGVHLHTPT